MAKSFAIAMLILGSVIGAGFASGREIVSFFGLNASPFTALLCGAAVFLLSVLFLFIGSRLNGKNVSEVNVKLAGRFHVIADAFLLVNNLIVLAGMLAGMDALGSAFLPIAPVYSVAAGFLCVAVVCKGLKGILSCNKIVTPIMVAALALVCLLTVFTATSDGGFLNPPAPVWSVTVYICMNMMLASTVITTLGKIDKKTAVTASLLAAVLLTALIFILMAALNVWGDASADMPVLDMAKAVHPALYGFMVLVIAVSIFTTMLTAMGGLVSWFDGFLGNRLFCALTVLAAAFVLANLGFANVVKFLYPVIGVCGVAYAVLGVIYAARSLPLGIRKKRPAVRPDK